MNVKSTPSKIPAILGIAAGVLAVSLAVVLMTSGAPANVTLPSDTGTRTSYSYYGGDAYTGMQQASADTARNVKLQSEIILAGFRSLTDMMGNSGFGSGAILLCLGLGMIAFFAQKLSENCARSAFENKLLSAIAGLQPAAAEEAVAYQPFDRPVAEEPAAEENVD